MTSDLSDIIRVIGDSLDQDEIVERLQLSNEELCSLLSEQILDNLHNFEDVYTDGE